MTKEEKIKAVADHIRPAVHENASTNTRENRGTMSMEIDVVHPKYGLRVIAFSDECLEDNPLEDVLRRIGQAHVGELLASEDYQPVVMTNDGLRPYHG